MRLLSRRSLARSVLVAAAAGVVAAPACAASSGPPPASAPATPVVSVSAAEATAGGQAATATGQVATTGGQATSTGAAATRSCGRAFTAGAKSHRATRSRPLVAVRAGRHACYDRLVLEFSGPVNGYSVRYVKQVVQDGSGKPVPLAGGAKLQVTVIAPAYDAKGKPTYTPADPGHVVDVAGYAALRQVAWAGSFEGYTTLGVGVRTGLPFRVSVLPGPGTHSRIVVDVAHAR